MVGNPVPSPSSNRPPVITVRLCDSHAAARAVRSGLASTNDPTRRSVVTAAAAASAAVGVGRFRLSGESSVE